MDARIVWNVLLGTCMTAGFHAALGADLPGTPTGGASFGTVEISDGLNLLPGQVTAGDVVLQESPAGGTDRSNWSDVVRFFNMPVTVGGVTTDRGFAFGVSDGEAGISSIAVINGLTGLFTLGDTLSGNAIFAQEVQTGVGTDADITSFVAAAGTSYNIHSDAAQTPDQPDVVLQPGGLLNPPPGMQNKPQVMINLVENAAETAAAVSPLNLAPGALNVLGNDGGLSDTIIFAAAPGGGTTITLTSDPAADASPPDVEAWAAMGDESITSGYIASVDVPEPFSLGLLGLGLAGLGFHRWMRR